MKNLLLITNGNDHPPKEAKIVLRNLIEQDGEFFVHKISTPEQFPDNLSQYDTMVHYYHLENISKQALASFHQFVYEGGGVVALHCATASFMSSPDYFKILGGRFFEHDVITEFTVSPAKANSIFHGISAFTVKDELYIHETEPDIIVHFTSKMNDASIPIVWTHIYGQGRVFYASPGHRTETMRHTEFQALILKGLNWVCSF